MANQVRLLLFILTYKCIVGLPNPLGNFLRWMGLPRSVKDWSLRSVQIKLIKIGVRLVRHTRRLVFQRTEVPVPGALFQDVLERIGRIYSAPS